MNLHHAYGIVRTGNTIEGLFGFFVDEMKVTIIGNPDFFHGKFETMSVDDSRSIKETALSRRFSEDTPRVFLVEMYGATREAQNALLKLLEEPEPGNHFFLVVPSMDILLPTLRSRLAAFTFLEKIKDESFSKNAEEFLKKSIKDRIAFVDELAGDISDEKTAKHEALNFINELETALYAKKDKASRGRAFEAIAKVRAYMSDRAPSMKMLLEYIALTV